MTKEEAQAFEKELMDHVKSMTAKIGDEPVYQLTGEVIPPEMRESDDSSSKG